MRLRAIAASVSLMLFVAGALVCSAETLKGVYSGSGGFSEDVHRVVMIEFGEDGSALVQQNWIGKDPQTWHAHWTKDGKHVSIVFAAAVKGEPKKPLLMDLKRSELTPTSWDAEVLGVLGPPKLTPFGGRKNMRPSVATCQGINTVDPSARCVTWDSRK